MCINYLRTFHTQGAFYGLLVGLVLGVMRMVCDFIWTSPGCGKPDYRPGVIAHFHYLHYAIFLFAVSILVTIVVSLFTTPIPDEQVSKRSLCLPVNFTFT